MARLIDADNLIKDIQTEIAKSKHRYEDIGCRCFRRGMDHAIKIARQQPTADPVKHGRWVDTGRADYYLNKEYRCSCCNSVDYMCSPYCYNCGAKMDSEHKEE